MTAWTIRLPYATPPLSLNSRMHWATKARITREIRHATTWAASDLKIPACERIAVELHYVPRDRRRRDEDNLFLTLKAAIDGIRDAGVVPDDSSEYVTSACRIDPPNRADPHLYLTIERLA
jgi:crossover junction endodeoxyribonuclease RusA